MHDGDDMASGFLGDVWPLAPDLDDPATLGCIEHGLLPAAWPGCVIKVMRYTTPSGAVLADVHVHDYWLPCAELFAVTAEQIAEALVAALEAAP